MAFSTSKATCMHFCYHDSNFTPFFFNIKYIITGRYKTDLLLDVRNIYYTLQLFRKRNATFDVKNVIGFGFFCDVNQNLKARRFLSGPLRKQKFTSTGSKGHVLRFVCFCVSRFVAFELQSSPDFTF